ncbi:hypothetical protein BD309DRAFT_876999 [Dichomitus squalens]|uniref:Uncharacterized protein n=1 Tax=Dichomitus squalens TaxID=114155 RepID=A0A4Q9PW70_9APHY|nr:hypothetical protein BD309DRAFT_876999 [Dichomitus squalens]TBU58902.1 hypothetical protein BD310DRAFT_976974 [Dichomitus squalens]
MSPMTTEYSDNTHDGTIPPIPMARRGESHDMTELSRYEGGAAGDTAGIGVMEFSRPHIMVSRRMMATSDLLLKNNILPCPYAPRAAIFLHSQQSSCTGSTLSDIVWDLQHKPWAVKFASTAIN